MYRALRLFSLFCWFAPLAWSQCQNYQVFLNQASTWGANADILALVPLTEHLYFDVQVSAGPGGSLAGGEHYRVLCDGSLELTATPDGCSLFTGWSGDLSAMENPLILENLTGPLQLTANFAPSGMQFSIDATAGTGGTVEGNVSGLVNCGDGISILAVPGECSSFSGWSGDLTSSENPLTLDHVQSDLHLVANFVAANGPFTLTVSADNGGSTDADGSFSLACETLTVWANAHPALDFIGWSGDVSSTENPLVVEHVSSDLAIIAQFALKPDVVPSSPHLSGTVSGLADVSQARVILEGQYDVRTSLLGLDGSFDFDAVPAGDYYLKLEAEGYETGASKHVYVQETSSKQGGLDFSATAIELNPFHFHWEEDGSTSGYTTTTEVVAAPAVVFLDETLPVPDQDCAQQLFHDYHIILSDEEAVWTRETAYRLLETLKTIPQAVRNSNGPQTLTPSKWILSELALAQDIEITRQAEGNVARISARAFVYAQPRTVVLDGERGHFFSRRLHHALVRFVTDNGTNSAAVNLILNDRYGVSTYIPNYTALTATTTAEDASRFQAFHPNELVEIINMFEEMPQGLQVAAGLQYLVRRLDGQPHPLYSAPAVAWTSAGYIEFMDIAFLSSLDDLHRLILHEKTHFLWANLFSEEIRNDWIEVGGWYPNINDPDGWSTTQTTTFVSAYAHRKNPNEDMAESLAYYVLNPAKLRSRAPAKFAFMRDRIMHGSRFISQIDPQYTFEVLNLHPDYDYPGKINSVDISVAGEPEADKTITVEIGLNVLEGLFEGASRAYLRIHSEAGTYQDLHLFPTNAEGSVLQGSLVLSKHAKGGFWRTDQIIVSDLVGNQRFEGVNDFGWSLYVNNPLEDLEAPVYVPGSMQIQTREELHSSGHTYTVMDVTWDLTDNLPLDEMVVYATTTNPTANQYRLENYGVCDTATGQAHVQFIVTEYKQPGMYGIPYVKMRDAALNWGRQNFTSPNTLPDEPLVSIEILTSNPDSVPPELDLDSIEITAEPTQPQAPNGETLVNIVFYARDDKSGVGRAYFRLLDPQGISHFEYYYHENFYTLYFEGDPTAWHRYEINIVLPVGSAPGTWGLQELALYDKALNLQSANFVETLHFELENPTPLTTAQYRRQSNPTPADQLEPPAKEDGPKND